MADLDAREDARHVTPGLWWDMHGESMPKLQKIALKVLSQPVSSSASERSWSSAKWIQTVRLHTTRAGSFSWLFFF